MANTKRDVLQITLLVVLNLFAVSAIAVLSICQVTQAATLTVNVSGVIQAGTCVLNGNYDIPVDFGVLRTNEVTVDGSNSSHVRNIPYALDCPGAPDATLLKMYFDKGGNAAGFNENFSRTNNSDLAIKLLQNSQAMRLGEQIAFYYKPESLRPKLQAVPVKRPGAALQGGTNFSGSATLIVLYN